MPTVRLGTRGSSLAVAQANEVKGTLEARLPGTTVELVIIKTTGDEAAPFSGDLTPSQPRRAGLNLPYGGSETGSKGMFVKELEEALLDAKVDLAVHSVKDLPTELPAGLSLGAVLPRRDPRDAVVSREGRSLDQLPTGARVGASSLRRQVQAQRLRRDLELTPIRGNVDTRLRKLDEGQYEAIILAVCGLERLGLASRIVQRLEPVQMLPAPGQGALGIEVRADREDLRAVCAVLDDATARATVTAERAMLKALGGGCQVPIAALATIDGSGNLTLDGAVFAPDGLRVIRQSLSGPLADAERIGATLASHLRAKGADRLLFGQKAQTWRTVPSTS